MARMCYADSSWETKSTQLKKYLEFCHEFKGFVTPTPCLSKQVALYITHLAKTMKYSSIKCYVSALSIFLISVGEPGVDYKSYLVTTAFKGCRRKLGDKVKQAAPILPHHLIKLGQYLSVNPGHTALKQHYFYHSEPY